MERKRSGGGRLSRDAIKSLMLGRWFRCDRCILDECDTVVVIHEQSLVYRIRDKDGLIYYKTRCNCSNVCCSTWRAWIIFTVR